MSDEVNINRTLSFSREDMRRIGYRVIDLLVDQLADLGEKPASSTAKRADMEYIISESVPEEGSDFEVVLDTVVKDIMGNNMFENHPRFFGFIPGPGNFVGTMADALASGFNIITCTWFESSGAAAVELAAIRWLAELLRLPAGAGGMFVSGGSEANLTGLAVARRVKLGNDIGKGAIYFSDQTHSSVEKGLMVLGFGRDRIKKIATDDLFQIKIDALKDAIAEDRKEGKLPFLVIANAGTTNTGAVDPLVELSELCKEEGLWLHADGAFGASAVITEKGASILSGIERVDSLSIDPHKWLFQPFGIGCVLVRDANLLRETFQIRPEYMQDAEVLHGEVNFYELGIHMSRNFKALKLWMSLKLFGLDAFREAISWGFTLAEHAEEVLKKSGRWQVAAPASLAIVAFRFVQKDLSEEEVDEVNNKIVDMMVDDRFAMVSSTKLRGRVFLRMCTINPRTTFEDIEETIARLERFGVEIVEEK
ncbi:MAG: aminotransferase class V-fold PLP-dependent enzyme [Deltaproteobacteria bacterium]|uniref:Aminotransferase class V-fold PLP-dependent enzyme n=1 Tax=Candidatus Zymogenus saltonus TaxID=2844893 RepID=A0A9D8KE09_9DELT|nr:aminotransferase class V-fold PLP-dependent enzyme [Candidatus Zymogenus saltonus]